ncbi:MAG: hypothetical protein JO071_06335, partial [Deltaproteobacteria bacterium]|nr:hypothetical protein [Deltaproteobacteria bacterium]
MKPSEPSPAQREERGAPEHRLGFARALWPLADTIVRQLPERGLAEATLRLLRERAPDEQLALAFLTKLLEQSPAETAQILRDPQSASDLIFCLGASELIGSGLATIGARWSFAFRDARTTTIRDLARSIHFRIPAREDTAQMTQRLAEFKDRAFLAIAIADLLGRLAVPDTVSAMSRL